MYSVYIAKLTFVMALTVMQIILFFFLFFVFSDTLRKYWSRSAICHVTTCGSNIFSMIVLF